MIVQQLKIQIVLYLHILISQPIIRLIGSTEEYPYDRTGLDQRGEEGLDAKC